MLTDKVRMSFFVAMVGMLVLSCKTGNGQQNQNQSFISDMYGIVIEKMTDTTMVYRTRNNRRLLIKRGTIRYEGGNEQLKQDIYNNLPMDYECNVREMFCVLFDSELNIKEIRASNLSNLRNPKETFLDDYIKAIQDTKGKWRKCKDGEMWYLYVFSLHIH